MNPIHDEQAMAAAYVLGALETGERRTFETHLATCTACQAEVRSLARVTDALGQAVPQRTPPPELRDRILTTIGAGATLPASARVSSARSGTWLAMAAVLIVMVALAAQAWRLRSEIASLESRLAEAERRAVVAEGYATDARRAADNAQSAMAVLAAPDLARIDLQGQPAAPRATARALWSRERGMVFTASNLPALPADRVYQVWVVTETAAVSAGLMTPDATGRGSAHFGTPSDIAPPVAIAVTIEPAGGVPAPTGEKVLIGTPSATL
jgi:anti-sigma-K factor RskA